MDAQASKRIETVRARLQRTQPGHLELLRDFDNHFVTGGKVRVLDIIQALWIFSHSPETAYMKVRSPTIRQELIDWADDLTGLLNINILPLLRGVKDMTGLMGALVTAANEDALAAIGRLDGLVRELVTEAEKGAT